MDLIERATGVALVPGNLFRVLNDGRENYPAWEAALLSARRSVHFEMYIVHADTCGRRFRDLLADCARRGVRVRVLCDWFGCLSLTFRRFWAPVIEAGGEVRYANPPVVDSLFALASRDHRKLLVVDGEVAFVSGLCIGDAWIGDCERGVAAWRDTGSEIRGPAVADADAVFASAWKQWGDPLPPDEIARRDALAPVGSSPVAIVATAPERPALYRLELLVATLAHERLWLTDAYFMATSTYLEALATAARNGVDVRLLVPGNSDIGWIANVSRTMYRRLLESGVRVFEWNGPMMHAKTAVADGNLVRIGSTNLNLSSWVGNWELDAIVLDPDVGREMEEQYLDDLSHSTEIVLTPRHRVRLSAQRQREPRRRRPRQRRSRTGRVMADIGFVRTTLGAAVKGHRILGPGEAWPIVLFGLFSLALATLFYFFPKAIAYPAMVILAIEGALLVVKGLKLRARARQRQAAAERLSAAAPSASEGGASPGEDRTAARRAAPDA